MATNTEKTTITHKIQHNWSQPRNQKSPSTSSSWKKVSKFGIKPELTLLGWWDWEAEASLNDSLLGTSFFTPPPPLPSLLDDSKQGKHPPISKSKANQSNPSKTLQGLALITNPRKPQSFKTQKSPTKHWPFCHSYWPFFYLSLSLSLKVSLFFFFLSLELSVDVSEDDVHRTLKGKDRDQHAGRKQINQSKKLRWGGETKEGKGTRKIKTQIK